MKIWLDDVRPAPEGYVWCKSVYDAIGIIGASERAVACRQWEIDTAQFPSFHGGYTPIVENVQKSMEAHRIELIDCDHDLGDYAKDGGDGVKLLDWLEETGRNYPIRIHSANAVGVENMRRVIERNGWKEVF